MKKHDEQYLKANIAIVEEQLKSGKVSNPAGYLLKAFQNDYRISETEYSRQQNEKEEINRVEQDEKEKAFKAQKEKRKQFEKWKSGLVNTRLDQLEYKELEKLMLDYKETILSNPIFSKLFEVK